jgi:hypothetical protein
LGSGPLGHRFLPPQATGRSQIGPQTPESGLPLWPFFDLGPGPPLSIAGWPPPSFGARPSSFHCRMASSFLWVARCTGFWLLQPPTFKMQPTWEGSYETPNRSRIRVVTLGWVHTSPWKPKDSAPWALTHLSHWLTAPWVTPKALGMSCYFQPFWWSSQGRNRRSPSRHW